MQVDDRLHAIADLDGREHRAAGVIDERCAALECLPGVAHVVGEEHSLALHQPGVEAAQRELAVARRERGEAAGRVRQRAAPIQQPGDRVREQRATGRWPGDDVGLLENLRRDDVEEVLRQAPDRRRVTKQLMRIQIDAPVKSVVVVEMPVAHEHFEVLQFLQRLLARVVETIHRALTSFSGFL